MGRIVIIKKGREFSSERIDSLKCNDELYELIQENYVEYYQEEPEDDAALKIDKEIGIDYFDNLIRGHLPVWLHWSF